MYGKMKAKLVSATLYEISAANTVALEHNTWGLAFVCEMDDFETIEELRQMLDDENVTAAQFETWTGEYTNIFVRYGYPSCRSDIDGGWFKVEWFTPQE
jgi:hypothetical protein